jgi:hypothetical protein
VRDDLPLQLPELRARLEPELLRQATACPLIGSKRFGLAARAVEREHQLTQEPLSLRIVLDERFELGYQLPPAPEREIGIDSVLERDQPPLLQPLRLSLREGLVQEICQRRSPPERKGRAQGLARFGSLALREPCAALCQEPLEPLEIELVRLDVKHVARGAPCKPVVTERLAKAGNVVVDRVRGRRRRPLSPDAVDQAVA